MLDLTTRWLQAVNPALKLREETEIPVLAALIVLYKQDDNLLNTILSSESVKLSFCSKLGISERSFNKTIKSLEEKGIIKNGEVIKELRDDPFEVEYKFIYEKPPTNV